MLYLIRSFDKLIYNLGPIFTVLCSNRVSQMTKTYNDIEAVTRLLEEVSFYIFYFNLLQVLKFINRTIDLSTTKFLSIFSN